MSSSGPSRSRESDFNSSIGVGSWARGKRARDSILIRLFYPQDRGVVNSWSPWTNCAVFLRKVEKKDSLLRGRNYSFLCPMVSGSLVDENKRRTKQYEKK